DALLDNCPHRARYANAIDGASQSMRALGSEQDPCLGQGPDNFLEKKRISLGAIDQQLFERFHLTAAQKGLEQPSGVGNRQRTDSYPGVILLVRPLVRVTGPIVDQEKDLRLRQLFHQCVEKDLCLAIDPVQILEDQEQGLLDALALEDAQQRPEGLAPFFLRLGIFEFGESRGDLVLQRALRRCVRKRVEQRQYRRNRLTQSLVQSLNVLQDFPSHSRAIILA